MASRNLPGEAQRTRQHALPPLPGAAQRHQLGIAFSSVTNRSQWQTRPLIEVECPFDHGEVAATPDCATQVVFDTEGVAGSDGDADIIALPDLLPGPEAWQRWIAFISGVRCRCTKHR